MVGGVISTPAKVVIGLIVVFFSIIIIGQYFLVFYHYSVERMHLNSLVKDITEDMERVGGFNDYNQGGGLVASTALAESHVTYTDKQGGKMSLKDSYTEWVNKNRSWGNPLTVGFYTQGDRPEFTDVRLTSIDSSESIMNESSEKGRFVFFERSSYYYDLVKQNQNYMGKQITLVIHRDIAFNMFYGKPLIMHLKEEYTYTHDAKYTPSQGINRESGATYYAR